MHTEEIIYEGADDHHTTMTQSEDGTVILHMIEPEEGGEVQTIHDTTGQEVQTTVLEIHDNQDLGQVLQVCSYYYYAAFTFELS